ncbi:MAG: hypothetical protein KDD69_08485 [Bdellovibrionales bacterium]|nr:hypothetical protein [Bdellovibrionales bacterium]
MFQLRRKTAVCEVWRGLLCALVFCALVFAAFLTPLAQAAEGADCTIASTAMESASRLRGLSIMRSVPCKLQDRQEVEQYLRETISKKIPAERIKHEGTTYRMLGLLPYDYDYLNGLIRLYTEQLGGYYDPDREYYAMAAWMPAAMQMPIAVHELTHALQDQHFELEKLVDHEKQDSDSLMARSALIEGDATAVMLDYSRSLGGQPSIAEEQSVSLFMIQNITGAMLSASLNQAPPALQATLIFPYVSGLNFAHSLLRHGRYQEIDRAFARLPTSTEEILHPKKYLAGKVDYVAVPTPVPTSGTGYDDAKPVFEDRMGEFLLSVLIGTWLPPSVASDAAAGWGGDRLALYELPDGSKPLLLWHLRWDDSAEAKQFFKAFVEAYAKRYQQEVPAETSAVSFRDPHFGAVGITLEEERVQLSIGGSDAP